MAESPVLASQFRPVAQFWLERYLDTVEVSGSSPDGPTTSPFFFNDFRDPHFAARAFEGPTVSVIVISSAKHFR